MPINDLPTLAALRTRMQWHQQRQRVLADNIANSDTPGFKPLDLVAPTFDPSGRPTAGSPVGSLPMMRTSAVHIAPSGGTESFSQDRRGGMQTRPAGNAVNLEDEMLKVSSNQGGYAAATALYTRSLGVLKTAIGKR
ncbi:MULTISPECIES: flagellar basal body rod protein FlgB [Rhodopseudomonas]|uniref:Flagellar basal body rod protein FlgB n=1 Tax=Rhodopseudomonas palustris (strain DX-1) TaxID=652103 RepID=E6VHJ3_RHOPX|nr:MULTISPECIES: flagellar basal body rod protein FlgB [Rhodopseudomonas]NEW90195.1 flagellar basal body rod protein FlgB [Rhodopseudomonas sp. WA056]QDL98512.1 flagellar basal body rod protein FlgB [Rhodopseudomonas palustris]